MHELRVHLRMRFAGLLPTLQRLLPFLCCIFNFHYASINTLKYAEQFHMKYVSHFNQFSIKGLRLVFSRLVHRVFINLSAMPSLISI